ncbi:FtsX-like permease family protein [Streptomyces alkaliterrae]|uniref:ABC transporter permease n=1 Tax=Streptomyces alkaliterrae TaxID=2213162 RepID=A0A5P0YRE0_9ACTN|nr:ABC transporter permease [Streptomyces alkaliterrae]MBB1259559.1 ABC transporter permease [Streptomyces alkaliterrae]MQS02835.1 FtsX-like permease family protein [Streptomyces alkaliterrae]
MFRTAARSVFTHRRRLLLPALAVLLGVAFTVGSLVHADSTAARLAQAHAAAEPDTSVAVRADAGFQDVPPPLDDALLDRLRRVPGVVSARGTVEGAAFLVGADGSLVGPTTAAVGVNLSPSADGADPRYPLLAGRGPRTSAEVAIDRRAADRAGLTVGDRARIVVRGEMRSFRLVGVVGGEDPRPLVGGTLAVFDDATARRLLAPAPGHNTAVSLTAARGLSPDELAGRTAAALPAGLEAVPRDRLEAEAAHAAEQGSLKLTTLLLLFAAVTLLVATFLVANTFTMLSAARAREHALLRAVGATRGHVLRLVLAEATLVGGLAALPGYLLGLGAARVLGTLFAVSEGPPAPLVLTPVPPLVALAVGAGVSAISAWVPARRAAAVSPVAALREGLPPSSASLRRRHRAGAAVTALGAALLLLSADSEDLGLVTLAATVLMWGLVLLTPAFALGFTRLARPVAGLLAGVRGRLAVANAGRDPRRTAATSATLMIGLSLISAAGVGAATLSEAAGRQASDAMVSDLRVTPVPGARVAPGTGARLARLPDAAAVTEVIPGYLELDDGGWLSTAAVTPGRIVHVADVAVREGSLGALGPNEIAVTRSDAAARGWRLGTVVRGRFEETGRHARLRVVALYDGPTGLAPALLSPEALGSGSDASAQPAAESVLLAAQPGRTDALRRSVSAALDNPALVVQDRAAVGREAAEAFRPFLNIVYALLSVAVLIGALGVVNTMAMAVFERRREIGLLRAVGLDRSGVGTVLRLESVLVSLLGSASGVLAGTAIGVVAVGGQQGAELVVPWASLCLFFGAAVVVGVLAAAWPARQAAAIPLLDAVRADHG